MAETTGSRQRKWQSNGQYYKVFKFQALPLQPMCFRKWFSFLGLWCFFPVPPSVLWENWTRSVQLPGFLDYYNQKYMCEPEHIHIKQALVSTFDALSYFLLFFYSSLRLQKYSWLQYINKSVQGTKSGLVDFCPFSFIIVVLSCWWIIQHRDQEWGVWCQTNRTHTPDLRTKCVTEKLFYLLSTHFPCP